jgi:hypothetical protein
MPVDTNTTLVNMIKEAITKPRITIPGEGLDYSYYIHALDAVYGLIKATFSSKTRGSVFTLALPDEISTLNLAYRLLELNPKATEIEFTKAKEEQNPHKTYIPAKNLQKIGWKPKVKFEKALVETLEYFHKEYNLNWKNKPSFSTDSKETKKEEETKKVVPRSEKMTAFGQFLFNIFKPTKAFFSKTTDLITKVSPLNLKPKIIIKRISILIGILIFYFALLAPIFQILIGGGMAYYYGKKGYQQAYNLNTQKAASSLDKASYFSSLMNSGWYGLRWLQFIPGLETFYENTANITGGIEHLATAGDELTDGLHPYANYFKNLEPSVSFNDTTAGSSRTYQKELEGMEEGVEHIKKASVEISLARESLDNIETENYPAFANKYVLELQNETKKLEETVSNASDFAYFLPDILGKDGRQTYVILFQNPMEIRSTGGWLTSYAVVGIEHGQIRNLKVEDVYTADGQLEQKVEPPKSMEEALDIDEWNLSLSNWSADFPQAAESAEYFLELEDRIVSADGVIAIDIEYARQLVGIWGEIEVPGESVPVTKDNLYDKVVEIHREFTPGSTNKPVFLSNLSNQLLKKLLQDGKSKWSEVAETTVEALNQKHMLIYMHNSQVGQTVDDLDWNGEVETRTNTVYPVEWNWGGNKANHFVNRSLYFNSNIINENTVQQKLVITYQNTSQLNKYPEGDYENFLRVYLPENIEIIRVEGIEQTDINPSPYSDLTELSGWVNVPVNSRKSITISYRLERENVNNFPIEDKANDTVVFETNIIKQPGMSGDPITVEVSYPENWEPQNLENTHRELNSLISRSKLETDRKIEFVWKK